MDSIEVRFRKSCPRRLDRLPNELCPLAVMRLKYFRSLGRESTAAEEESSIGCPFSINHQMSCYCFYAYEAKYLPEQGLSDQEIAALLSIEVSTVKETYDIAIAKTREAPHIKELKETMGKESILDQHWDIDDETIYCE